MSQQNERTATLSKLVGKQVKLQLFLREMSGRDLAGKLGVSPSWVSYRLSGKQEIGIDDLFQIATVLGVDLNDLITPAVLAEASQADKEVKRDFEHAPTERTATIGHPLVAMAEGGTRPADTRGTSRPNGHPKAGPTRPGSPVPAARRRPARIKPPGR